MSGRQRQESGRGRDGGDATAVTDIDEVSTEARYLSVLVAGLGRQLRERDAPGVGRQVFPHRPDHAELRQLLLARHVQGERHRERASGMDRPERVAKGRADLPLAHPLRNNDEEIGKPEKLLLLRPPRREPEVALELPSRRLRAAGRGKSSPASISPLLAKAASRIRIPGRVDRGLLQLGP